MRVCYKTVNQQKQLQHCLCRLEYMLTVGCSGSWFISTSHPSGSEHQGGCPSCYYKGCCRHLSVSLMSHCGGAWLSAQQVHSTVHGCTYTIQLLQLLPPWFPSVWWQEEDQAPCAHWDTWGCNYTQSDWLGREGEASVHPQDTHTKHIFKHVVYKFMELRHRDGTSTCRSHSVIFHTANTVYTTHKRTHTHACARTHTSPDTWFDLLKQWEKKRRTMHQWRRGKGKAAGRWSGTETWTSCHTDTAVCEWTQLGNSLFKTKDTT